MVKNSWQGVEAHAAQAGAKFPELVAAQWGLESGFGKHTAAKNNFFGLKSSASQESGSVSTTKEFYDGQWVTIRAGFIDFPSLAAAIEYLVSKWYLDWRHFKGVNRASSREEAARLLQSEGYATDPDYANKLIRLMNQYAPLPKMSQAPISLINAAKFYKELKHQDSAWRWLQLQLTAEQLSGFASRYRDDGRPPEPLRVPYFSQRDNASGRGYRECFSSSCAMVAAFYGKVQGDDEYNTIRERFGDTTNAFAQVRALESLGLKATFRQDMRMADLQREINEGFPVAVGWLHQGNYRRPTGGGHWSVVVGLSQGGTMHNDPMGEPDLVRGGHISAQGGAFATFPNQYWLPRWEVKGGDGWAMLVQP